MRRALTNDVVKILCYVAGVLLLAAVISPMLYNGGKALYEVTHEKQTNGFVKWLAEACGRSNFPRFFNRSVMLSALVLFFPLVRWLKIGRSQIRYRDTPWSFRLPESAIAANEGQPLQRDPKGWLHLALGFTLALGGLALLAWWLVQTGAFVMEDRAFSTKGVPNVFPLQTIKLGKVIPGALFSSLLIGALEEIVFRGVLLGIFLRAMKPWAAIVSLSLLFAFLHFLDPKTLGSVPDPESAKAGFWLLGRIFAQSRGPAAAAVQLLHPVRARSRGGLRPGAHRLAVDSGGAACRVGLRGLYLQGGHPAGDESGRRLEVPDRLHLAGRPAAAGDRGGHRRGDPFHHPPPCRPPRNLNRRAAGGGFSPGRWIWCIRHPVASATHRSPTAGRCVAPARTICHGWRSRFAPSAANRSMESSNPPSNARTAPGSTRPSNSPVRRSGKTPGPWS
ncbi:MAG: CPBP family intramembrane metalloprotease [Luteolibacter sp.]